MSRLKQFIAHGNNRLAQPWSRLNALGQSRVLRSSYAWLFVVPIAARLLARAEEIVQIPLSTGSVLTLDFQVPFSWKLFYFAAMSFATASVIYSVFCPDIIRAYQNFADFHADGKGSRQLVNAFLKTQRGLDDWTETLTVMSKPYHSGIQEFMRRFAVDGAQHADRNVLTIEIPDGRQGAAFWYVREYADVTRPRMRCLAFALYVVGFFFILWVVGQNFVFVVRHVL